MNVLLISTDFPPWRGGISTHASEVAKALNNKAGKVIVLVPGITDWEKSDSKLPYKVIRTPNLFLIRYIGLIIYTPVLLRKYHIELVLHAVWPTSLISHLWHHFFPIPYFVFVYASEILDDKRTLRRRLKGYLKEWKKLALVQAKGIFPVSRFSANLVKNLGVNESQIHVINPGVDPNYFKQKTYSKDTQQQNILLTVARLDLHKGHAKILEALAILKKQGLRPHYLIVGIGDEDSNLRRMVKNLHLENQVEFAGFVPDERLSSVYVNSDIFVMTSQEIPGRPDIIEGFGIAFIEASASGLPVIGGRSGGVPDAIKDGITGLLVNPDDSNDIALGIKKLLTNPTLCAKMGKSGRDWIEKEMNWDKVADKMLDIVKELI